MKNIISILILIISTNCFAEVIVGTVNPETLIGTKKDDYIKALDGNDNIYGSNGIDNCRGGKGDDWIYGGNGNDYLLGQEGNDELNGGDGNDNLYGGSGNDILIGGSGADYFIFYQGDGINRVTSFEHGIDKIVLYGFSGNYKDLIFNVNKRYGVTTTTVTAGNVEIWFVMDWQANFSSRDFVFRP